MIDIYNLLVSQFKDKPNFTNFFNFLAPEFQILADSLADFALYKKIDDAEGVMLDGIGEIIGLDRLGYNDSDYRERLKYQIVINSSTGTGEIALYALKLFTKATYTKIFNYYPAKCAGFTDGQPIPENIKLLMESILPAGVEWLYTEIGEEPFFSFVGNSTAVGGYAGIDGDGNLLTEGAGKYCGILL